MAAKGAASGTRNAKNLEALGATRLAELLILLCEGNNASKRRLRLAADHYQPPVIEKGAFSTRTRRSRQQRDPPQRSRSGS